MWRTSFRVRGSGIFPIDMLRYDQCCPADSAAVNHMAYLDRGEEREVTLNLYHHNKLDSRPSDRWISFGWAVIRTSVHTVKL